MKTKEQMQVTVLESFKAYRKLGWTKNKAIDKVRNETILATPAWLEVMEKMYNSR